MKRKIKARKQYNCDTCFLDINVGETYELTQLRLPRYAENRQTQIGIEYLKFRMCQSCVEQTEKEAAEWEVFINTKEYKYQQSIWEHRYP